MAPNPPATRPAAAPARVNAVGAPVRSAQTRAQKGAIARSGIVKRPREPRISDNQIGPRGPMSGPKCHRRKCRDNNERKRNDHEKVASVRARTGNLRQKHRGGRDDPRGEEQLRH